MEKKSLKYQLARRELTFKIKDIPVSESHPLRWIKDSINGVIKYIVGEVRPTDKIGLSFTSDTFSSPAYVKFTQAKELTFEDVWNLLGSVFQSNSEGLSTDTFRLTMTQIKVPIGQGRVRTNRYDNFNDECKGRKGIIVIHNNDNLCLPRAIVVGKAYADKRPLKEITDIRRNYRKMQDIETSTLIENSGIIIPAQGCGIEEIRKFQVYLKAYKISVYSYRANDRVLLYEGPEAEKKINLYHHKNHFNVITSCTSAFACSYYCEDCHFAYNTKDAHKCPAACPACLQKPRCEETTSILCKNCNRSFRNALCFDQHTSAGVCNKLRRCNKCHRTINKDRIHSCNEVFCTVCKTHKPENHLCFIQKDVREPPKGVLFIFFDLETRQETRYDEQGTKIHEPNLCVMEQRCEDCMVLNDLPQCSKCEPRRIIINTGDIIFQFMRHVLNIRHKFCNVIIIAHNGQAFDHQFILKYLLEKSGHKPELIMRGSKIILMTIDRIKFIDSLNYFPMALSALPTAFDLPSTLKKGYFPHLFNTLNNMNYIGPLPQKSYYSPNTMKICEDCDLSCPKHGCRNNFLKWYTTETEQNREFNFQKDFQAYCVSDVQILTQACIEFRRIMLSECKVCPFSEGTTIASSCNLVFRRNFLKPETIAVIPRRGYRNVDRQSKLAIKWMIEESDNRNIIIKHAANGKEVKIYGKKVDGYSEETRQIFEFHG